MFWASSMPAAVQRSAISALRQRLTLPLTGENSGNSCRDGLADELEQRGDVRCAGDVEVVAGMVPEADADLGAGLHETEENITAVVAGPGPSCAGDLAPGGATRHYNIFAELRL